MAIPRKWADHHPVTHRGGPRWPGCTQTLQGLSLVLPCKILSNSEGHQTPEESLQHDRQRPKGGTWESWGNAGATGSAHWHRVTVSSCMTVTTPTEPQLPNPVAPAGPGDHFLLSVSLHLTSLDAFYKRTHAASVHLGQAYLTVIYT